MQSSLICAIDAQIAVKRDASENIVATLELSKDGEAGAENVSPLVPAEVGRDQDGEPIRSCIIVEVDASHRRKRPSCQDTKSRTDGVSFSISGVTVIASQTLWIVEIGRKCYFPPGGPGRAAPALRSSD